MKQSLNGVASCLLLAAVLLGASACNLTANGDPGKILGQDHVAGPVASIPSDTGSTVTTGVTPSTMVGAGCHTTDPEHFCLALKYVVYKDAAGTPVVSQSAALNNLKDINSIWSQCNVAFQIDDFEDVQPTDQGFTYNTSSFGGLDDIRSAYGNSSTLLVVTTGKWNRTGTLGNTGANAWTNMPGGITSGVILEGPVGNYGTIIAHELGHYLNLDHVADQSDVMNPIIYSGSTGLSQSQCTDARAAIKGFWEKMVR